MAEDNQRENQGEGNREADRRYRKGVRKTVASTTEEEREQKARDLTQEHAMIKFTYRAKARVLHCVINGRPRAGSRGAGVPDGI